MKDPYEILGISRTATKVEIKKAYRELAKKYHPDLHQNDPNKDQAEEKFIEVQKAYDSIINGEANSRTYSRSSNDGEYDFSIVRQYIRNRNIRQAENILDSIKVRNAEWNFLKGVCLVSKGRHGEGMTYVRNASDMEPGNTEYASYLNQAQNGGNNFRRNSSSGGNYQRNVHNYNNGGTGQALNCCVNLICADCCCECMGGDLIACC